jgi:alginate O-acetyltransferase complex protein AlgI
MLFHSPLFLTAFLPIVLGLAWLSGRRGRNVVLLLASLFFYAWGEGRMVGVLIASAGVHHLLGLVVARRGTWISHAGLAAGIAFDLGLLVLFKYANWLFGSTPDLALALRPVGALGPPIGVSFFTFQALSYLVDVHRGVVPAQRNPFKFALYLSLFPQLIAGPIVRYADIATQIDKRTVDAKRVADGFRRFATGLGKKVLLAGSLAPVADHAFSLGAGDLGTGLAWLGLACYSLQIYLDFSGYSDMAIGIGRMLGFDFLENFLHPYSSRSVTEFWRRWHVSLSSWFRDYLYIPLGGNRKGHWRTGFNLLAVFVLCGLWHGAAWTFIFWGTWHGALLIFERVGGARLLARLPRAGQHMWLVLVVCLGWVLFRVESLDEALNYFAALAGAGAETTPWTAAHFLNPVVAVALIAGCVASVPWVPAARHGLAKLSNPSREIRLILVDLFLFLVLAWSLAEGLGGTSTPFIYFRF